MANATDASRIEALERAVDELRGEVESLRQGRNRPMSTTGVCPACGAARVLHFRRIGDAAHARMIDFTLVKRFSMWRGIVDMAGALEAFACRSCRLVEWRAISLEGIEADGDNVAELAAVDAKPRDSGPFR